MKVLKWLGIILLVVVVLFVGGSFLLPSEYSLERSVVINAAPQQVHVLVGDLTQWPEWQPWTEMDPTITTTLGERTTGVGAHQEWTGESGAGELTFTMCEPATGVAYDMSFEAGYESVGAVTYEKVPDGTKVTWKMAGTNEGIVGRYMGLAMDAWVGPAFEQGLQKLKAKAEALPPPAPATEESPAEAAIG